MLWGMNMTVDERMEKAARKLCTMRGTDPDGMCPCLDNGQRSERPRWTFARDQMIEYIQMQTALRSAFGGDSFEWVDE